MEKMMGPTPNGGDYSLIGYFDAQGNSVDKDQAVKAIITEYKNDGTLLCTTYANVG